VACVLGHSRVPSGDTATPFTARVWPLSTVIAAPVFASQIRAVLSSDPVTMRVPSGDTDAPHATIEEGVQDEEHRKSDGRLEGTFRLIRTISKLWSKNPPSETAGGLAAGMGNSRVSGPHLPARSGPNPLKTRLFLHKKPWLPVRSKAGGGGPSLERTRLSQIPC